MDKVEADEIGGEESCPLPCLTLCVLRVLCGEKVFFSTCDTPVPAPAGISGILGVDRQLS